MPSEPQPLGSEDAATTSRRTTRGWLQLRQALLAAGLALAGSLGATALIGKLASYSRLGQVFATARPGWLVLCLAGELVAYGGYMVGYRQIAAVAGGPRLGYRTVLKVVALIFGGFVVSTAGGLAVAYWALRRAGEGMHAALRRVVALNTLEFGMLAVAASIAGIAILTSPPGRAAAWSSVIWLAVTASSVALALWLSAPGQAARLVCGRTRSGSLLARGRQLLRCALTDAVGGVVYVRAMLRQPRRNALGLVAFPLYWAGDLLCLWAAVRAFGYALDPQALVLAYATGYIAAALPLPAGGSGGVEAATTFALHAVGTPLAPALAGVLAYRLATFWLPILPALAALPATRTLRRELARLSAERTTGPAAAAALAFQVAQRPAASARQDWSVAGAR